MHNDNKSIAALLEEILVRLAKIEAAVTRPTVANINTRKPKLRVITDEDE